MGSLTFGTQTERLTNGNKQTETSLNIWGWLMITIEKVSNGYILRIEEGDTDETIVCQREFGSMNAGLGAVCQILKEHWFDEQEGINLTIEAKP